MEPNPEKKQKSNLQQLNKPFKYYTAHAVFMA